MHIILLYYGLDPDGNSHLERGGGGGMSIASGVERGKTNGQKWWKNDKIYNDAVFFKVNANIESTRG